MTIRSPKALVKPEILEWLRLASGYSVEETAKRVQTKPDNVVAWERGVDSPSMPQLRKLAKTFKRPISYFYLPHRVNEPAIPHDFRRLPDEGTRHYSPALLHEIRLAYHRRSLAIDLNEEMDTERRDFEALGSASIEDDPEQIGQNARDLLAITYNEQSSWRDPRIAYNAWRSRIEALSVLVFQVTTVEKNQMLGFSLVFSQLPVITINRKLHLNGRIFTMLHEFAHLLLGEGGICDLDEEVLRPPREQRVEIFCNHVAGAVLVPKDELLRHRLVAAGGAHPRDWADDTIESLARNFGTSREVIVRRLLMFGRTTQAFYMRKRAEYAAQIAHQEREQKEAQNDDFRRNMALEAVSNLSSFARLVINGYHSDVINLSEASRFLGVKAEKVAAVDNLIR